MAVANGPEAGSDKSHARDVLRLVLETKEVTYGFRSEVWH
jgi:hypothetical protein